MMGLLVLAQTVTGAGMRLDWSIPAGTAVLVIGQFVAGIIAIMRVVAAFDRSIEKRFNDIEIKMTMFKEGDIREFQGRLVRLETGQDEWTKALRQRSHDQGNEINTMKLEIDRLKREPQ